MSLLFRARTTQGYAIKVLTELLKNNIKNGCFCIDKKGITFCMIDTHRRICIDFNLLGENFDSYVMNMKEKLLLGMNLIHLQKMLKPIKKKDSIELSLDSNEREKLCIKMIPKEKGNITTSYIKIQEIQDTDISLPEGYENYISIPASTYQKMCKDIESISQSTCIKATPENIRFVADLESVYSRDYLFGDGETQNEDEVIYTQTFESTVLNGLGRISGLGITSGSAIQIYVMKNLPLLLRANVGTLGKINIYIKSREQLEKDDEEEENN